MINLVKLICVAKRGNTSRGLAASCLKRSHSHLRRHDLNKCPVTSLLYLAEFLHI